MTEFTKTADSYRQATGIFAHQDGVVVRTTVDGENVDILVTGANKSSLLTALSHNLSDNEIKSFRELLGRQGR